MVYILCHAMCEGVQHNYLRCVLEALPHGEIRYAQLCTVMHMVVAALANMNLSHRTFHCAVIL